MTDTVRIATRGSDLALWQAYHVRDRLQAIEPGLQVELVVIKTKGDKILDTPLAKIGGKGLFVKEIEQALARDEADIAVHSMKDVPAEFADGMIMAAITERANPFDALCSSSGATLAELPQGARVGTSSVRRSAQLLAIRPDLQIGTLRGNVNTRLRKLDEGEFDAIMLAVAGLDRLGFSARISDRLEAPQFLPAIGQGTLGIETRADDEATTGRVRAAVHCESEARRVTAERAFLIRLGGGCQTPLAAYATDDGAGGVQLDGLVARLDGTTILRSTRKGSDPEKVGRELAEELIQQGAAEILAECEQT